MTPESKVEVVEKVFFEVAAQLKQRKDDSYYLASGLYYFCEKILDKNNVRKVGTARLAEYIMDK